MVLTLVFCSALLRFEEIKLNSEMHVSGIFGVNGKYCNKKAATNTISWRRSKFLGSHVGSTLWNVPTTC